jgi:uncharacterized membrane protein
MMILSMPLSDFIAAAVFLICWLGYGQVAKRLAKNRPSLVSAVMVFRQRWIERMCERENHTADATLISNLLRGALFFASTTVLILGGLVALLGTAPKVAEVISQLPYTTPSDPHVAEIKALILILVYIYAFFKFTWSGWLYNILSILVGAMPRPDCDAKTRSDFADSAVRVAALAGENYNNGVRAYYFSIPPIAWFIDPYLFLGVTLIITIVLYRREFYSPILTALRPMNQ